MNTTVDLDSVWVVEGASGTAYVVLFFPHDRVDFLLHKRSGTVHVAGAGDFTTNGHYIFEDSPYRRLATWKADGDYTDGAIVVATVEQMREAAARVFELANAGDEWPEVGCYFGVGGDDYFDCGFVNEDDVDEVTEWRTGSPDRLQGEMPCLNRSMKSNDSIRTRIDPHGPTAGPGLEIR